MDPLVFHHHPRPQIWGQRRLERHLGKQLPPGKFGESWEISTHSHHVSRVAEGPLAGTKLDELWRQKGEILGADPPAEFPLLVKFLDCHLQLSVQVHPDDELAARIRPGEQGKTEAWVIISAEADARIYAGLRPALLPKCSSNTWKPAASPSVCTGWSPSRVTACFCGREPYTASAAAC